MGEKRNDPPGDGPSDLSCHSDHQTITHSEHRSNARRGEPAVLRAGPGLWALYVWSCPAWDCCQVVSSHQTKRAAMPAAYQAQRDDYPTYEVLP